MGTTEEMKILELYSGIGGMHYALRGKFKYRESHNFDRLLFNYASLTYPI